MKRISLQWRITLMTVLLIGVTCVAMNLLLCSSGVYYMDTIVDSFSNSIRVHISALRKKLRAVLGYDPIRNRIGEGYLMGGEES